jgi:hypothetical protein
MKVVMNKEPEIWYKTYKILYGDKFERYKNCISMKLNRKLLFKYRIRFETIVEVLEKTYDDLACVFSSEDIARLDIFVDVSKIKFPKDKLLYITMENAPEIYMEEVVILLLENLHIFGIPELTNIYYTRGCAPLSGSELRSEDVNPHSSKSSLDAGTLRGSVDEWYIETEGGNFRKILGHPIIDMSRVESNNVWDIYNNLGIEAAREMLINEFISIMEGINTCHVKLLVDKMTFNGTISSISRYTLRKDESGPLGRASFEETLQNFINASFAGDIENTNGVSASIICGKRSRAGTGMVDLKVDLKSLPKIC